MPKHIYAYNNGVRLHCLDWGGERLPPMLLVHGLRDCARSWDMFAEAMSSDYRVFALDSRGHGDSDWAGQGGYRFESYAADIDALIRHLRLDDVILVGHSAGGRYAWSYAVERPDKVRALVVADIDPDAHNPQTARDFVAFDAEPAVWQTLDAVVERLDAKQKYTPIDTLRTTARILTKPNPRGDGLVWKSDIRVITEYERPDVWESWGRISCPVLLVRGRQSALLTHETAVRMREALPEARVRLAELEGGGHWFYQDFPGAFEATVRWFLREL